MHFMPKTYMQNLIVTMSCIFTYCIFSAPLVVRMLCCRSTCCFYVYMSCSLVGPTHFKYPLFYFICNKKASIRWQDSAPPISGCWPTNEPNAG